MNEVDKQMFELMDILKRDLKIRFFKDFYRVIIITNQNAYKIKNGLGGHFTNDQVYRACNAYNINANWIFGFELNVYRD